MQTIDSFVNNNAPNVHYEVTQAAELDEREQQFTSTMQHAQVNDKAYPVLVYVQDSRFVAWYDIENAWGYVAA